MGGKYLLILNITVISIVISVSYYFSLGNKVAVYNFIRTIIFSFLSIYLFIKPGRINFFQEIGKNSTVGGELSEKVSIWGAVFIALINVLINYALRSELF